LMKKPSHKTESDAKAFKVPGWFRKLWNGTLFGKRKDELILRILKLGGKGLLMARCGLALDKDMIGAAPAPSMKLLLAVLREREKSSAKATSMLAHPENYNKKRTVLINRKDLYCETVIWTPKKAKHQAPKI
jgi:hypothetical protein